MPEMVRLMQWLEAHIPAGDDKPSVTRISHGDYRWVLFRDWRSFCGTPSHATGDAPIKSCFSGGRLFALLGTRVAAALG